MTTPKHLLDQLGIVPKKSLGQNFLQDPNTLDRIVASAQLTPDMTVLEIGAGTGALTIRLAKAARRVIAVEIDQRLEPALLETLADAPNVEITFADILEVDVAALVGAGQPFVVVANVPYYITSAILRHLLESSHRPRWLVMTVQREVADRLIAKPGDMSLLAVSIQFYGQVRIVGKLSAAVFYPRPDVDSAVIRLDVYETPRYAVPDEATFFKVARAGFGQRRKQLKNAIAEGLHMSHADAEGLITRAGIDPMRRAETLTLDEWAALARTIGGL